MSEPAMRTITLLREIVTVQRMSVPEADIAELTARWSAGDHDYAIQCFIEQATETMKDRTELCSSIWYESRVDLGVQP